jgi:hypothetical integral membrane protein (TIGR02206 family)
VTDFWDIRGLEERFQLFSPSHLTALLMLGFLILLVYAWRERLREPRLNRALRYGMAGLLLVCEIALESWQAIHRDWTLDFSLPLHLCSISLLLSIAMLLTRSYRLFEFLYLAGMGGALQALITPDLGHYSFPHFRWWEFFVAHGVIVIACLFMVFVERYRPTLASIGRTWLWLNVLAVFIYGINLLTEGNYMFLARKPPGPSLLDLLGPWPWYILSLQAVAVLSSLLLYLPFALIKPKNAKNRPARS